MKPSDWIVSASFVLVCISSSCSRDDAHEGVRAADRGVPTATDQEEDAADLALAGELRRELVDDATLSMSGKNVTVVVEDGVVTLRGKVASQAEKERITAKARALTGVTRVEDHLEVDAG